MDRLIKQLLEDGVAVFENRLDKKAIAVIRNEVDRIRQVVFHKINAMPRPLKTYSDIAEREPGRLDYRCGFTDNIFATLAEPIVRIVNLASPSIGFRYYWGAIPSLGGSGPTPMHRDVYPILSTTEGDNLDDFDINLPPYYFTVLIPLMQITPAHGPTTFIKGSHRQPKVDVANETIHAPLLSSGDIVIFDGRTLHQGSANQTTEERMVAYITFVANWYHDQTFKINEYLFPELAMLER